MNFYYNTSNTVIIHCIFTITIHTFAIHNILVGWHKNANLMEISINVFVFILYTLIVLYLQHFVNKYTEFVRSL